MWPIARDRLVEERRRRGRSGAAPRPPRPSLDRRIEPGDQAGIVGGRAEADAVARREALRRPRQAPASATGRSAGSASPRSGVAPSPRTRSPWSSAGITLVSLSTSTSPGREQLRQVADMAVGEAPRPARPRAAAPRRAAAPGGARSAPRAGRNRTGRRACAVAYLSQPPCQHAAPTRISAIGPITAQLTAMSARIASVRSGQRNGARERCSAGQRHRSLSAVHRHAANRAAAAGMSSKQRPPARRQA